MGLLSELRRQAKRRLKEAQDRHAAATPIQQWRLDWVIRERKRTLRVLELVQLGIKHGRITPQDTEAK